MGNVLFLSAVCSSSIPIEQWMNLRFWCILKCTINYNHLENVYEISALTFTVCSECQNLMLCMCKNFQTIRMQSKICVLKIVSLGGLFGPLGIVKVKLVCVCPYV